MATEDSIELNKSKHYILSKKPPHIWEDFMWGSIERESLVFTRAIFKTVAHTYAGSGWSRIIWGFEREWDGNSLVVK